MKSARGVLDHSLIPSSPGFLALLDVHWLLCSCCRLIFSPAASFTCSFPCAHSHAYSLTHALPCSLNVLMSSSFDTEWAVLSLWGGRRYPEPHLLDVIFRWNQTPKMLRLHCRLKLNRINAFNSFFQGLRTNHTFFTKQGSLIETIE